MNLAVTIAIIAQAAIAQGDTVQATLRVTQSGSAFNAYHVIVEHDMGALTYAGATEGPYMPSACGQTFKVVQTEPGRTSIVPSILCPGLCITGPGDLYSIRYVALEPGVTFLDFDLVEFACAGNPVQVEATGVAVTVTPAIGLPPCRPPCDEIDYRAPAWGAIKELYR